ncbi:MAG: hypothetical protein HY819_24330 [Acidobacteria bacterium]|nr:hypothetical protein [Acidobacteriota bacterium]
MATIKNNTTFKLKFAAYRADGLLLSNDTPVLESGECVEVSGGDTKGIDWFMMLVFLKDSIIPPSLNVTQQTQGSGITIGISAVAGGTGGGLTVGVNTVGTINFSTPLAGQVVADGQFYNLEKTGSLQLSFQKLDTEPSCRAKKMISNIINR